MLPAGIISSGGGAAVAAFGPSLGGIAAGVVGEPGTAGAVVVALAGADRLGAIAGAGLLLALLDRKFPGNERCVGAGVFPG